MNPSAPALVPELLTPRLRLRGHRADDHDAAVGLWTQPEIYRLMGATLLGGRKTQVRIRKRPLRGQSESA